MKNALKAIKMTKIVDASELAFNTSQILLILVLICYIYLTAVGLTPGGSSTSHIYTQTVRIIQR
jgi:hypothetical protein